MSEENVEVVRGAYENFNSGNVAAVLESLHEDVEWTEPGGGSAPAGTFNGAESVGDDVFAPVGENFEEFSVAAEEFEDQGERVVVTGRFVGKSKAGVELDVPFTHTYVMLDNKVVSFNNETDEEAWGAAWGA